ncbi:signal peptidase I [Actinotalea solisilvae]|uniref:signal peptidase I n=1 Tax=Actinotalea solisilvae TaxID=2072922 RepID=UPI0018F145D6|nr:signal peptidase I [Actinotalea solisilvae]
MGPTGSTEHAGAGHLRRLLGHALTVLWVAAAVVAGWLLWPSSLGGCTTLTIVSGRSMEPTFYTGDLVVSRCGPVEVGDVITYSPPDVGGARVIHRIVDGTADGWVVQGDNNDFLDPWTPTEENILGSAVLHLPHVGRFASILLSPLTWLSLLVVALAVMVWPGKDPADPDTPDAPDADGGSGPATQERPAPRAGALLDGVGAATRTALGVARAAVRAAVASASRRALGTRRGRRAAVGAALALAVGLPLGAGAGVAHAASLSLRAASLGTFSAGHPCPTTVQAVSSAVSGGTSTSVSLTFASAACSGRTVRLAVVTGSTVVQGTALVSGTSAVVPVAHSPQATTTVVATVDGWHLQPTYTPPAAPAGKPIDVGNPTTVLQPVVYTTVSPTRFCAAIDVQPTAAPATWALRVDLNQRPFNGVSPYALELPGWLKVVVGAGGIVHLEPNGSHAFEQRSFTLCATTPPAP